MSVNEHEYVEYGYMVAAAKSHADKPNQFPKSLKETDTAAVIYSLS